MILDIYKDSLEYSAKDWKTLVILGVFAFLSFLLIPAFLITGYNYRVINTAVHGIINGRDPLPGFDDIIEMFIDGVKVVIVQIAYLIVPAIIFLIFAVLATYRRIVCWGNAHRMFNHIRCWNRSMPNGSNRNMPHGIQ